MNHRLLSILFLTFAMNLFADRVNAIGSPTSTHPPSDIDWNSLDSLFEIPFLDNHKDVTPIEQNDQSSIQPEKKKKKNRSETLSYKNQQKKVKEDKKYAKRRRAQICLANQTYRANIRKRLSSSELEERRLKINEKARLNYTKRKTSLSASEIEEHWSEFEDILQLPTPDLSPVRHDSSLHSTTQTGSQSTTIKKQNLRSKEVGKAAYAKEKSRMEKDPEFAEKRRKQKKESSRKHQLKIRSTLTEEQRRINKLRQNQRYRKHYHIQKAHYGGAYGSAKSREIYALREKEKAGLASLEDLEKLKQAREKANEAVRKSRSKKSKSTQSQ